MVSWPSDALDKDGQPLEAQEHCDCIGGSTVQFVDSLDNGVHVVYEVVKEEKGRKYCPKGTFFLLTKEAVNYLTSKPLPIKKPSSAKATRKRNSVVSDLVKQAKKKVARRVD